MTQAEKKTATEQRIDGGSGLRLFVRSWRPAGTEPGMDRGVVAIVPGFNSHSGYYGWVGEQLASAGLAVYAVDLRGRGESDGERFYVDTFSDYLSDVDRLLHFVKSREPGLPVFLLWDIARAAWSRASMPWTTKGSWRGLSARASRSQTPAARIRSGCAQGSESSGAACACAALEK